ncbi:MAG: UbiX family flavin prenyltransferase [Rhodospirillales bacterium]|nr:MAG: UbiX family flavin prenyltransferase [Rhodospirillales bacterium]
MSAAGLPLIVAITGASGAVYGIECLKALKALGVPTHLVISPAGLKTIKLETGTTPKAVRALAAKVYEDDDIAAPIASGSFKTRGMIVAPCSIKTLSAIANSYADNLIVRSADVCLKERRPLVLMVRETPLHQGHLELMVKAAELGAILLPPLPAFYHKPKTIEDIVLQSVGKALDLLGIEHDLFKRWGR